MVAAASVAAPQFCMGDDAVEQVTKFRYLERILSEDDQDVSACIRSLQRARTKWAVVSRVLKRHGASQRSFARFDLVIASTVLLYGSDTWVVTKHMQNMLTSFHNRCARDITRRHIRYVESTEDLGHAVNGRSSQGSRSFADHALRMCPSK
jgi:hypothetical protein